MVTAAMAALYDLMLMLDPNVPDERHAEILQNVQSAIESDGTLVGVHDWGTRRMTFEIDHRPEAAYHLFQLEAEPKLLERLNHTLRITDGVLRFRIIRLKAGSPPPPPPRPAEAPGRPERRDERPGRRDERPSERDSERTAPRAAADAPSP
jgi:small subunit ribosomal protein S6